LGAIFANLHVRNNYGIIFAYYGIYPYICKKIIMKISSENKARFDTRLSREQKNIFERAAILGGYRSLTDFVILTVQKKAKEIIQERERIIASNRDSEIFFDAIANPDKPNTELILAAKEFKSLFS